jgi:hypothetical protein
MKILVYKDDRTRGWVAGELSSDIFTQGQSKKEALNNLLEAIILNYQCAMDNDDLKVLDMESTEENYKRYEES